MIRRLLEPRLELDLYDPEHVLVRVSVPGSKFGVIELVLEDAALAELERQRHARRCTNETVTSGRKRITGPTW